MAVTDLATGDTGQTTVVITNPNTAAVASLTSAAAGPRVLRTVPGRMLGPGHCSVTVGPDEATRYLVYHAWDADLTARRMCIDELRFTHRGPRSPGPTWTEQSIRAAPAHVG